jgi:hypothetical protein
MASTASVWRPLLFVFLNEPLCKPFVPYTVCSESRCALRLRYVDFVVSIDVIVEVCCCFTYSVVKQRLKCNTGKVCNCLIQLLLTLDLKN